MASVADGGWGRAINAPDCGRAQQPKKVARIGFIVTRSIDSPEARATLGAFRQGLREHGYIDGQNVLV
jgi:putative ABC transport system substrate-binding protein